MTDARKRIAELEEALNELRASCGTLLYEYDAGAVDDQTLQDCDDKCARAALLLSEQTETPVEETGAVERYQDAFIVIHEGDGRHAVICHSHKEAAEAIIKGMWSGTVQEALEQDDFLRGMYEETIDPQSDSWADFDGQRVGWAFEDGRVDVIRIPMALAAMRPSVDAEKIAGIRARHESVADMADDEWDNRIYTIADDAFSDRAFLLSVIEGVNHE